MVYDSIRPGEVWLDTEGKRIQAHAPQLFYEDGNYYWYGENKEKTTGEDKIWHWGVRCYSSKDLYNWEDRGIIIEPDIDDEKSTLHPHRNMDRPHIIYNRATKKYVCWLKIMSYDDFQMTTILTADHFLGPYTVVKEGIKPLGMSAGDFDLAIAPDGKAYYYFERVHSEIICADITDDFTDITGYYSTHLTRPCAPYIREAPAHFYRKGKHYLLTSGITGYFPNPTEAAIADTWHGPYADIGRVHPGDPTDTSFHSQIASVFKVPGKKDLYIACADRWLPEHTEIGYADVEKAVKLYADPSFYTDKNLQAEFAKATENIPFSKALKANTSIADYVWLPIRFADPDDAHPYGQVIIDWKDEWRIEDYE